MEEEIKNENDKVLSQDTNQEPQSNESCEDKAALNDETSIENEDSSAESNDVPNEPDDDDNGTEILDNSDNQNSSEIQQGSIEESDTATLPQIPTQITDTPSTKTNPHDETHNEANNSKICENENSPENLEPTNVEANVSESAESKQEHITNIIQKIISDIDNNIQKDELVQESLENKEANDKNRVEAEEDNHSLGQQQQLSEHSKILCTNDAKDELPQKQECILETSVENSNLAKEEEERIAALKQRELDLLKQHEELTLKIQEQQILAEKLSAQNQKLQEKQYEQFHSEQISSAPKAQENLNFEKPCDLFSTKPVEQSENIGKQINLDKIFKPADDYTEVLPRNRKLYASSAFYSPQLHPTVEDQLELARKISSSLSDNNNETSKGQSMYVNRKKRSVKWIHEGSGQRSPQELELTPERKDNECVTTDSKTKSILSLVMNPRGHIIDYNTDRDSLNIETGLLSPEKCAELINALQTHKGKGAELFAKRRKKVEKWIVDENNARSKSPSGLLDNQQQEYFSRSEAQETERYRPASSNLLPKGSLPQSVNSCNIESANSNVGNYSYLKRDEAINTNVEHLNSYSRGNNDATLKHTIIDQQTTSNNDSINNWPPTSIVKSSNPQRDLAYMPSIPKGWNAPSVTLPKELYVPKEIPLECYAPPPARAMSSSFYENNNKSPAYFKPLPAESKLKSFTPSPLPQQKLDIFESTSPIVRDHAALHSSYIPTSYSPLGPCSKNDIQLTNSTKVRSPVIQRPAVGHILKSSNFNNLPRGWTSPSQSTNLMGKTQHHAPLYQTQLPYTDF